MATSINIINCFTLIDITHTGVLRYNNDNKKKRDQQANYETLLQVLGLRTQPMIFEKPYLLKNESLSKYSFGSSYSGIHNVWVFKFSIEHADVYSDAVSEFGLLEDDLRQVPIIAGLDETVDLPVPVFSTIHDFKNTYFTVS
jgi:hypothetical protein